MTLIALPALADTTAPLAWNPSVDSNVAGYKIYYGVVSHVYTSSVDVGNVTNATITGLSENTTYYFAATTYDVSGVESDFSNEATYSTTNAVTPPPVVYQPPTLDALSNVSIAENAGLQTVNLTGISLGTGQILTVTAASSNPALIPNPSVNYAGSAATGTLTFAPANNVYGTATITVTVNNGLVQSNLVTRTFTVSVAAVNQPPTLNSIGNLTLNYNSAAQTVSLSGITSGATNEIQTLKITAVSSNTKVVANPTVSYTSPKTTGTLTIKPVVNASGTVTITVTVNDGGLSNNLAVKSFTVAVLPKAAPAIKPVVLNQLTNCYTVAGKTIAFSAKAAGLAPLKYQWKHNGINVPGATSPVLTLKSVTAKQAGLYYVTVSNGVGATNSSAAAVIVYPTTAATLSSSVAANGRFSFTVNGVPGYTYAVQASSDMVNWTTVETNTAPFVFVDENAAQFNQRFYRTVYPASN